MVSKSTKPQLVQNGIEKKKPKRQRRKATNILGMLRPPSVSQITVEVASTIENAESIPSMYKVKPNNTAQKFGASMVSMALGYAMKARPIELVFDLAKLS